MIKSKISWIGAGNVGWHLAPALDNAGFPVGEVYSRNRSHAEALSQRLYGAKIVGNLDFAESQSDIFILTVSDDAIPEVTRELVLPENALLLHTSGSVPISTLEYAAIEDFGALYPLQTFSKARKVRVDDVPFMIEGSTDKAEMMAFKLASAISKSVQVASSETRSQYHLAAVFACNFTNYLMSKAESWVEEKGLDFDVLHPLIVETIQKSLQNGPSASQTGPARRGDINTIAKHLEMLNEKPEMAALYRLLSDKIREDFGQNM